MAEDGKTEKPTPKRLREARKKGQVPRTQDASTWLAVAAAAAMLPHTVSGLADTFRTLLQAVPTVAADPTATRAVDSAAQLPMAILITVAPFALATGGAALLGQAAQGVYPSSKGLKVDLKKLNPAPGLKRMFGIKAWWEAAKALLKLTVIATVVYSLGRTLVPQLVGRGPVPLSQTVELTFGGIETLLWTATVAGLLIALADYAFSRHQVMKKLKMSLHEIKEEAKQTEGDPMLKGAIRARQMAMSRNRMLSAVVDADVVLVNPTHYAVALKYTPSKGAPRVVAKGTDHLALKIREKARENRVAIVEDKPLTRLLYRVCDAGEEIPAELYLAVARILAFVMSTGRPGRTSTTPARRPMHDDPLPVVPTRSALRVRRARENRAPRSPR